MQGPSLDAWLEQEVQRIRTEVEVEESVSGEPQCLVSLCDALNQELREVHIALECRPTAESMKTGIRAIVDRLRKAETELAGASMARVINRFQECTQRE